MFRRRIAGREYTFGDLASDIDVIVFFYHNVACCTLSGEWREGNCLRTPMVPVDLIAIDRQKLIYLLYDEQLCYLLPNA